MNKMRMKLAVGGLVLAGAVAYLAVAGARSGWVYYVPVDEFEGAAAVPGAGMRVRLTGLVAEEGLEIQPGAMTASFSVMGQKRRVPVSYRGVIPDMFKAGAQVVVEGKMGEDGVFQADKVLTKCASKYEAQPAGHVPVGQQG